MFRGARSRCPANGKEEEVSPQEEALGILRNFLDCVAKTKVSDHRWEHICSCVSTMARQMNRSVSFPKRRRARRGSGGNSPKTIISLCLDTEKRVNRIKELPPDQRLFLLEQLQTIRQEI